MTFVAPRSGLAQHLNHIEFVHPQHAPAPNGRVRMLTVSRSEDPEPVSSLHQAFSGLTSLLPGLWPAVSALSWPRGMT
jgi:hypothetical protein